MGAKYSALADKYEERSNSIGISLEGIEELDKKFELEIQRLKSKNASKLSEETRESLKNRYLLLIQQCENIVRSNDLIFELAKTKAPGNKRDETTFVRLISTARQVLKKLK